MSFQTKGNTISPKGGTRESATQNKVQKAIKSLFTAKRVNNPERKMFKETQTIQREPKYRNNIQEVQANKSVR